MDTLPEFSKLKAAFGSLETADEFLNAFHKMEKSGTFDERDLGLASVLTHVKGLRAGSCIEVKGREKVSDATGVQGQGNLLLIHDFNCDLTTLVDAARGLCMFHAVQRALAKELSKIYVVATSDAVWYGCGLVATELIIRHPPVKWAQRSDELYITVELPDAQDVKFRLEPEGKFYFSATAGAEKIPYEVNFNLFDKVDVNNSKASVGSRNIFYLVKKAKSKWWDRLLKQRGKPPVFLKVDWDKWVDEDEEQEADKHGFDMDLSDMDFSKFNMVGGEGPDDDNDDDDESEVTGEASADNEPDSKRRRGSRS
ncbi:hypothetical protein RIF29_20930 [Crotalaria pallida]|uniref:Co-chaperone protein p23 n=1 Tax=Crotalaria pallida TaxID=3830 RepID=A0AAN9F4D7_CROPI